MDELSLHQQIDELPKIMSTAQLEMRTAEKQYLNHDAKYDAEVERKKLTYKVAGDSDFVAKAKAISGSEELRLEVIEKRATFKAREDELDLAKEKIMLLKKAIQMAIDESRNTIGSYGIKPEQKSKF